MDELREAVLEMGEDMRRDLVMADVLPQYKELARWSGVWGPGWV